MPLVAPFPWFGSKKIPAPSVWERLGDVPNLVIPFAGSCAELWARPHVPRIELVNDADGHLVNFLRAVRGNAAAVVQHADRAVTELDLIAIHNALVDAREAGLPERLRTDADFFDAELAGRWLWAINAYVGSGFCLGKLGQQAMPYLTGAGRGCHGARFSWETLHEMARRLRRVKIVCGDWKRCVTTAALGLVLRGHGHGMLPAGVILDPPYPAVVRGRLYAEQDGETWFAARDWALTHGENPALRIVLYGYEGTAEMPSTWACVPWKAHGGYSGQDQENANRHRERIWFSPACLDPSRPQASLF